jgi:hypothetical protein
MSRPMQRYCAFLYSLSDHTLRASCYKSEYELGDGDGEHIV